jgi:hypothetical protein
MHSSRLRMQLPVSYLPDTERNVLNLAMDKTIFNKLVLGQELSQQRSGSQLYDAVENVR